MIFSEKTQHASLIQPETHLGPYAGIAAGRKSLPCSRIITKPLYSTPDEAALGSG